MDNEVLQTARSALVCAFHPFRRRRPERSDSSQAASAPASRARSQCHRPSRREAAQTSSGDFRGERQEARLSFEPGGTSLISRSTRPSKSSRPTRQTTRSAWRKSTTATPDRRLLFERRAVLCFIERPPANGLLRATTPSTTRAPGKTNRLCPESLPCFATSLLVEASYGLPFPPSTHTANPQPNIECPSAVSRNRR